MNDIQLINNDKSKFDFSMARELMKFMTSKEATQKVVQEMKLLYEFYQSHKDDLDFPIDTFCEAYCFLQSLPFIKKEIPTIEDKRQLHPIDTTDENWKVFKKLCNDELIISKRLVELSNEIQSLECNKRQPLELFSLRDEYKLLRKTEGENLVQQKFVLNKIIQTRKMRDG